MRAYNKALDCLALAASQLLKGRPVTAGQLMVKASKMPDIVEAINIIEASNKEAHTRMVKAATAAKKQQAAKRQVKAAEDMEEDEALKGLVGDNDELGDEEEEPQEVDSRTTGKWADVGEEEPADALNDAITKEDAEITAKLAQVLSAMTKRTAAKKR
jgi:hypothetical protein